MIHKSSWQWVLVLAALGINVVLFVALNHKQSQAVPDNVDISIHGKTFHLEVAESADQQEKGLMNRPSLPADAGMLFIFDEITPQIFWMKDCLIPLDVVFMDAKGTVFSVQTMARPPADAADADLPKYDSLQPVAYAIELNAGAAKKAGIKIGDMLDLPDSVLKRAALKDERK